ncbi:MAG: ABC transporter ATP-binding protein [Nitrospirota bacterium]|nr:ABC transporter ATP-binding protein [Nitrospirota bacterium]
MIRTENVTKIYNPRKPDEIKALDDASLSIGKGEVVVLKGPSGSGKTTLLSLLGCMGRPTSGRIMVDGKDVAKLPERFLTLIRRKTFGFIFQQFNLIRNVSVLENVLLPLYPVETSFPDMQSRAEKILSDLNINNKMHMKVNRLSGGEQQRVAIARALINEPDIIIADEPTAHLDSKLSSDLLRILETLNSSGKTIVIATHDPFVYDHHFVKRIVEMKDGHIREIKLT